MGIRLAIDDFGTGYSSLLHLKQLPLHEIKIDRSFVMGMLENPDDEVIVRSIVELAANLNLSVVAEGVETAEVWRLLGEYGCDAAQGFWLSRPVAFDGLVGWLGQVGPRVPAPSGAGPQRRPPKAGTVPALARVAPAPPTQVEVLPGAVSEAG